MVLRQVSKPSSPYLSVASATRSKSRAVARPASPRLEERTISAVKAAARVMGRRNDGRIDRASRVLRRGLGSWVPPGHGRRRAPLRAAQRNRKTPRRTRWRAPPQTTRSGGHFRRTQAGFRPEGQGASHGPEDRSESEPSMEPAREALSMEPTATHRRTIQGGARRSQRAPAGLAASETPRARTLWSAVFRAQHRPHPRPARAGPRAPVPRGRRRGGWRGVRARRARRPAAGRPAAAPSTHAAQTAWKIRKLLRLRATAER